MPGAQAGYVHALTASLALNAEIAYRFIRCPWDYGEITIPEGISFCSRYISGPGTSFYSTLPVTLGIRYNL